MLLVRSICPSDGARTLRHSSIALFCLLVLFASTVRAATVTLAWDPNPEPNIAGYIVSYGTSPGSYSTSVDVGKVTTWAVSLTPGARYYFAAQAYNTSGLRSGYSTEVSANIPANAPSIASLSPTSGSVGTPVTISGANFGATQGTSVVRFNGTVATPTSWSASAIVAPVPTGAATGPVVVTVNGVASSGVTFTVPTAGLPAPWVSRDIGSPAVAGRATYTPNIFNVSGAGADIWGVTDQFQYVYQPLDGNGTIIAAVAAVQGQDPWTKVGVMIRADLTANGAYAMVAVTPSNGTIFQSRAASGGQSTSTTGASAGAPRWVALNRNGNSLSGFYSTDARTWTPMGTRTIPMATRVYAGMAVTSHNTSATATGIFVYTTVISSAAASQTTTAATVPSAQAAGTSSAESQPENVTTQDAALSARRTTGDYDGDGKADLAIFRPSTGAWQILTSSTRLSAAPVIWGTVTDVPVPGDYDGDGKTDIAFYRPSLGLWSIRASSANDPAPLEIAFMGDEHAVPVPGDYDGDGKTDPAFYSPAAGNWRVLESSSGFLTESTVSLGSTSDIAVPGDYDGDGKTDPAVYRAATGQWIIRLSSVDYATTSTLALGTPADIPVPGDYDGDGVTDIAVFQPATSAWVARLSSLDLKSTTLATLGAAGDTPVSADFDGDGRADLAVFHDGLWRILASSAGYSSGVDLSWGRQADVPLH